MSIIDQVIRLKDYTPNLLEKEKFLLYIYTPLCGTCNLARSMLKQIEIAHKEDIFYQMNASFYPEFMQKMKIENVPCLLIQSNHQIKEKVYTFHSVPNIYHYLIRYMPELFIQEH